MEIGLECPRLACKVLFTVPALKSLLNEWLTISGPSPGNLNIFTTNIYGSLIASAYRGNKLMQWDTDLDFLIWAHDTINVEIFMDAYNSRPENPFLLVVQPDWRCKHEEDDVNWGGRSYYDSNGANSKKNLGAPQSLDANHYAINFVAPNVRLIHKATHWYIDVWAMYSGSAEELVSPLKGKETFETTKYVNFIDLDYNYIDILRKDIFPLKRCFLEGIELWCPNNPQRILRQVFHSDPVKSDHNLDLTTGCWEKKYK